MAVLHESGKPPAFKFLMDGDTERPKSALTRGVQIREFKELQVNPEPIVLDDTEILLAEYLSPRRLRDITGVDDLESVQALDVKVDTTDTSLGNFGSLLPNLRHLRLSNSCIASLRDLGSGFDRLMVLWLSRCCLEELDGLASLAHLRELYVSYNEIQDLSPCSMLDQLQILDLEGNNVDDVCQIEFLTLCSSLRNLTLEGNPICITPRPDVIEPCYDYRAAICEALPQVHILDDESTAQSTNSTKPIVSVFEDDWALINELIAEGDIIDENSLEPSPLRPGSAAPAPLRPGTARRPATSYRPETALRPTSAKKLSSRMNEYYRPLTGGRPSTSYRPGTSGRPGTSSSAGAATLTEVDGTSELTSGSVVCGNPSKALRSRRKANTTPKTTPTSQYDRYLTEYRKSCSSRGQTPDGNPTIRSRGQTPDGNPTISSGHIDPDKDKPLHDLFSQVDDWKKLNLKSKADREEERLPAQILHIGPDDHLTSSSEDDVTDDDEISFTTGMDRIRGHEYDDVINDDVSEAEENFRHEMSKSVMMLRDSDDVTEIMANDVTDASSIPMTSSQGTSTSSQGIYTSPPRSISASRSAGSVRARRYIPQQEQEQFGDYNDDVMDPKTRTIPKLNLAARPPAQSVSHYRTIHQQLSASDLSSSDDLLPNVRATPIPPSRMRTKLHDMSGLPSRPSLEKP